MDVKFKIKRFDPTKDTSPRYMTFQVDITPGETVLMGLLSIRDKQDQTLGMRCSCRSAICGSCAMKVNGQTRLACNTPIESVINENGEILVEPMGNQKIIRDLIVEMDNFWAKLKSIDPFLQPKSAPPKREYICTDESMLHLSHVTECILCGSCYSDCTILEVDKTFLGPAALAKVYRFVADPRDGKHESRLAKVSEKTGMWDCTHCFKCVEACPKLTRPLGRILALRKIAMEKGMTNNNGARHCAAIVESVEHSGTLNEVSVMPKSFGYFNIKELLGLIPTGLRMMKAGKMPKLIHPKIPKVENVQRIYKKFEK